MPKEPNTKKIGLFMVVGITIFLVIIGMYIKKRFFYDQNIVVMYFDESIKGLNVGSSVVFKGVEIGKVTKIELIANSSDMSFSIPVYATMIASQKLISKENYQSKQAILDALIKKGLRARLTSQSYLTGQLLIELEMLPGTPINLKSTNGHIFEIPTVLSPMGEISKGIQNLPIRESVEKFNQFFDVLNAQMPVILPEVSTAFRNVNKVVTDNSAASADSIRNFNKAMIDLGKAAKSFRNFSDYLERHPEAILKGKRGN